MSAAPYEPTPADRRLLNWLLHYPLQRKEDMTVAWQVTRTPISRALAQLGQAGLVDRFRTSQTGVAWLHHLTHAGLLSVAHAASADPAALAKVWGADETGLLHLFPRLEGLFLLQGVVNSLVLHAPAMFASQGRRADVDWAWQRSWHQRFRFRGRASNCAADASVLFCPERTEVVRVEDAAYPLLLLHDSGLTGPHDGRVIAERLEQVLRYRESAERAPYYRAFPLLLILVPTRHQRDHWHRAAEALTTAQHRAPLNAAIVALAPGATFESAWALPWRDLATRAPCRLQDLLVGMPLEALPTGFQPTTPPLPTSGSKGQAHLVKGNFPARAAALARRSTAEIAPAQLCLRSLQVSPTAWQLLSLLYTAPLLTIDDVAAFTGLAPSSAKRRISELQEAGWAVRHKSAQDGCWILSKEGLRLMAARLQVAVQHVAEVVQVAVQHGTEVTLEDTLEQRGLPLLLQNLRHTRGLYGFLAELHRVAREAHQAVRWWETGLWCARRYRDQQRWHDLRPDALLEYGGAGIRMLAWIEWDEGSMPARALAAKFHSYAAYARSRAWAVEQRPLPLLLVVCPEPGQERVVLRLAAIATEAGLHVWTTTQTRLAEQGPLAAIWAASTSGTTEPAHVVQRRRWAELNQAA